MGCSGGQCGTRKPAPRGVRYRRPANLLTWREFLTGRRDGGLLALTGNALRAGWEVGGRHRQDSASVNGARALLGKNYQ